MADREQCRWFNPSDYEWDESESCAHPLLCHFTGATTNPIRTGQCHGCPCHEPKQAFDPTLIERITMADIDSALHLRALLRSMKTQWLRLAGLHIEFCESDGCHEPKPVVKDSLTTQPDQNPNVCPNCGGPADNGFDRCVPPNPYWCTKCNES